MVQQPMLGVGSPVIAMPFVSCPLFFVVSVMKHRGVIIRNKRDNQ